MKLVADTSVFLAVTLEEPERARIIELTAGTELLAPEVLPFEIGNALTALMKRRILDPGELVPAWNVARAIPVELRRPEFEEALEIASRFNIYAYDAYFVECALGTRRPLLTLDRRLREVADGAGVEVLE